MRYRPLGRTGLTVSAIGFGGWGIGGPIEGGRSYGATDDATSGAALEAAFAAGVTFYDTAPLYGHGHSESLIGQTFAGRRDQVVIATKAGYSRFDAPADYHPQALRRSLEGSLRRLRTDYVDLFQLHDAGPADRLNHPDLAETLDRLREAGLIRAWGASVKRPEHGLDWLETPGCAALQVNFSMMDPRCVDHGLLARAEAQGVGIIARTPLNFGFLTGTLTGDELFPADDHRSRWSRAQLRAWADCARTLLAVPNSDPAESAITTALRFILAFSAVSTTIPGMLTPAHVAENTVAGDLPPLDAAGVAERLAIARSLDSL